MISGSGGGHDFKYEITVLGIKIYSFFYFIFNLG